MSDVVIRATEHTRPAWLARRMLTARRQSRGAQWIGSRSSREIITAAIALVGAETPDAVMLRATSVDGRDQVIRWLAPGEEPGPEAMTFAYWTGAPGEAMVIACPTDAPCREPSEPRSASTRLRS